MSTFVIARPSAYAGGLHIKYSSPEQMGAINHSLWVAMGCVSSCEQFEGTQFRLGCYWVLLTGCQLVGQVLGWFMGQLILCD